MSAKTLPPVSPSTGKERRRSERKQHVVEAWIVSPTATKASERVEVTSVNINRHGVCFSLPSAIPAGAYYIMEVIMGEQKIASEIRAVSCRKSPNGRYDVGAEFC